MGTGTRSFGARCAGRLSGDCEVGLHLDELRAAGAHRSAKEAGWSPVRVVVPTPERQLSTDGLVRAPRTVRFSYSPVVLSTDRPGLRGVPCRPPWTSWTARFASS